jgi:transcriptional regulator GlxA family with amidase domain
LLVSDPASTTVREIAAAWGFAHLGRFTQQYTAVFGETPKTTLDRRPGTDG